MIPRYQKAVIEKIWSDAEKTRRWQETELAVIEARSKAGQIPEDVFGRIELVLMASPIDVEWWKQRDKEIHHDLQAFVEERRRHLPEDLKEYFHDEGMTSFDTEESAMSRMIEDSVHEIYPLIDDLEQTIMEMARKYRYTPMLGRTHGQHADLQSFGKRCLTWLVGLRIAKENLFNAASWTRYSKISGAVGNYLGLDPEIERAALGLLEREPFYGATQIMPRILYSFVSDALCALVLELDKIAHDIRLGARSPKPIYQEPFKTIQKGSSAMPHKRNPIRDEQTEGMARMALAKSIALKLNNVTDEERAIEQSCVERVEWPDLFHVVAQALETQNTVLSGLKVYPDNMLWEIYESRGCYAASVAKDELKKMGKEFGITPDDAYRIVQLAAANAMNVGDHSRTIRKVVPNSFDGAEFQYVLFLGQRSGEQSPYSTIRSVIRLGKLQVDAELAVTEDEVRDWNKKLHEVFALQRNLARWEQIFKFSYLLRNEHILYEKILGDILIAKES